MSSRISWMLNVLLATLLVGAIWKMSRPTQAAVAEASAFDTSSSIIEVMQGIVDPSADFIWDAVSYDVTAAGVKENIPKTPAEWLAVRRNALQLLEATNLLKIGGRRVAPATDIPGWIKEPVAPSDLAHPAIQAMIDGDPAEFGRHAQDLANGALLAIRAVDARSVDSLFTAGDVIDKACETCHLKYWYPDGSKPAESLSRKNGKKK